jgi:hypothetical protein
MKLTLRSAGSLACVVSATLLPGAPAVAATAPPLGSAAAFSVLGGSNVINTGPSTVATDLGVFPGSVVTGFPPGLVLGAIHTTDTVAQVAQTNLTAAYTDAAAQTTDADLSGQDLGGLTLTAGAYRYTSSALLTGTLTLDAQGNPNAVFIFQIAAQLTTATGSVVQVINGGSGCNVFWQVGSSATLNTTSRFVGNIMALSSITMTTGTRLAGRALARNATVTLDSNDVVDCSTATGGSTGDPHLRTLDGLAYDLQACGDFVLSRSENLEVQARQSPWNTARTASVNTAVAVKVGEQTVAIDPFEASCSWASGLPEGCVTVNHHPAAFACEPGEGTACRRSMNLGAAGRITEELPGPAHRLASAHPGALTTDCLVRYTLLPLTGETVSVCVRNSHIDTNVELPRSVRSATGLLGDGDGDFTNDLQLRNGTSLALDPAPYADEFDSTFTESWRVKGSESFFETAYQQSTDCHAPPPRTVSPRRPPRRTPTRPASARAWSTRKC